MRTVGELQRSSAEAARKRVEQFDWAKAKRDELEETFKDQKNKLENALREWMGDQPQIDDILVMGLRI